VSGRSRPTLGSAVVVGASLVLLVAGDLACRSSGDTRAESGAASASASTVAVVDPVPSSVAPSKSLELSGTYVTERAMIEMKREEGRQAAWDQDDGKEGTGPGTLAVSIDDRGTARGTAEGAMGAQIVRGVLDGDTLRLTLGPEGGGEGRSFSGILVAERRGDEFRGDLRASSGDSRLVRRGTATLTRRASP